MSLPEPRASLWPLVVSWSTKESHRRDQRLTSWLVERHVRITAVTSRVVMPLRNESVDGASSTHDGRESRLLLPTTDGSGGRRLAKIGRFFHAVLGKPGTGVSTLWRLDPTDRIQPGRSMPRESPSCPFPSTAFLRGGAMPLHREVRTTFQAGGFCLRLLLRSSVRSRGFFSALLGWLARKSRTRYYVVDDK